MNSEKAKMLAGELYDAYNPGLVAERTRARALVDRYNATGAAESALRLSMLKELLGTVGDGVEIEPAFRCDYGKNIHVGKNFYMNFGCVILDCAEVRAGDNVYCGPNTHIYTAHHPTDPNIRLARLELAHSVTIGNNVWLGGGVIVCPGVAIGDNTTIGAGSIVTKNIPANVIAAGNPCRIIRRL